MLWLFALAFAALPFLAARSHWLRHRRLLAVSWFLAGVGIPAIVFVVCLKSISVSGDGSPGDGLGLLIVSGIIAAIVWLTISITAFFAAPAR
jgi:hypothetical protein